MLMKNNTFFVFILLCFNSLLCFANTIPVVFVHSGDAYYLKDTLTQAKQCNERVILLGDENNRHCAEGGVEYYPISDFNKAGSYFTTIYRHMTYIPYEIELSCFTRWFVLQEFMEINNIPISFYVDSDVMLYCDASEEYETNFKGCDLAIAIQHGFCGGLVSYWQTDTIRSFCNFLNQFYEDKERLDILEDQFKLGGEQYQDDWPQMTNWVHENWNKFRIGNLSSLINNATFDSSIWHDYILVPNAAGDIEYKRLRLKDSGLNTRDREKLMKDIVWNNGHPYCYSPDLRSFIQFKALHFQGGAKTLIQHYKTPKIDLVIPEPYASINTLPFYMLGFFSPENQKKLEHFIKTYEPKTIVELGCWMGTTTSFMALLMPKDSKIYSIDYFDDSIDPYLKAREDLSKKTTELYQQFLSNMRHYQLCNKVIPVKMGTIEAANSLNIKADLIYIDASMEEELVFKDIMAWYPKLNKQGILCGNNWLWCTGIQNGVTRAAQELGRKIIVEQNFWYFDLVKNGEEEL